MYRVVGFLRAHSLACPCCPRNRFWMLLDRAELHADLTSFWIVAGVTMMQRRTFLRLMAIGLCPLGAPAVSMLRSESVPC